MDKIKQAWFQTCYSKPLKHLTKLSMCLILSFNQIFVFQVSTHFLKSTIGFSFAVEQCRGFIRGFLKAFIISSKHTALEWLLINYDMLLWILDPACKISKVCQEWQFKHPANTRDQMSPRLVYSKERRQELMNFRRFLLWFIVMLKGHWLW